MAERKSVVLAEPRGFCAGVRRAIAIVERALEVLERLAALGYDRVEFETTATENVVFSMPAGLAAARAGARPDLS